MADELTPEEDRLVTRLAAEFADRWRVGEVVTSEEYLGRLPNERSRHEFKELVNLDRLFQIVEDAR